MTCLFNEMNKKKLIIFEVIACLAMAACAKNEVAVTEGTSDKIIAFSSPVVGVPTKGEVGYPTSSPSFHVHGRIHNNTYNGWSNSEPYMDAEVVHTTYTVDATEYHTWVPTPAYYWPKNEDYKLSFIAYSPNGATGASIDATGVKFDDYVVEATNPDVDLLYSLMTYNQIKTTSTGVNDGSPEYPAVAPEYQGVNIHFKHALSSINFKVKTAGDFTAAAKIILTSIELKQIYSKSKFVQNLKTGDPETGSGPKDAHEGTPAWSTPSVETNYTALSAGDIIVTEDAQDAGSELILLPQTLEATTQKVTITYTIQSIIGKDSSDNPIFGIAAPSTADVYFYKADGDKWEIGKKYVYTISIGLKKIFFSPDVYDWESGSETEIEI